MRKVLASLFLGAVLLAPCGAVSAETPRPAEPRWGIRPERSAPALLDLARWLSARLRLVAEPLEADPVPLPAPDPAPAPGTVFSPDVVCPERQHCPIG